MMGNKQLILLRALALRSSLISLVSFLVVVIALIVLVFAISITEKNGVSTATLRDNRRSGKFSSECHLFSGKWVFDNVTYPLYHERQCTYMSDELACEKFGRTDLKYQNWRWQPHACNLPRFNATTLLERLRGKRLVFVGDSLNRGQWFSMVCLLESSIPTGHKSMHTNGSLRTFKAMDYNASIEFYWAPLLVESNSDDPVSHRLPERIVRTESITKHARHWMGADILVFNSYLWWRRAVMKVLWGSFDGGDGIYKVIQAIRGFEMALRTWSDWLEVHVDPANTQVFFVSMSPTHFWADEWGMPSNQNCYNESEPIIKDGYWGRGSDIKMIRVVEATIDRLRDRGLNIRMIYITQLSEYRKDGHPSIHRKQWVPLTNDQISNPTSYADCIHWCLPGVPDAWNELLYAHIFSK